MIVNKITHGYVIQKFDTKINQCVSQEFIAGDECSYENDGEIVNFDDIADVYFPYDMVQPDQKIKLDSVKEQIQIDIMSHFEDCLNQDQMDFLCEIIVKNFKNI